MRERQCALTRWTPGNKRVKGNEIADTYAKWAADGYPDAMDNSSLREAGLAHLTRRATEAGTRSTKDWILLDPTTRQGRAAISPPQVGEDTKGPPEGKQRNRQSILSAPLRPSSYRPLPGQGNGDNLVQQSVAGVAASASRDTTLSSSARPEEIRLRVRSSNSFCSAR